MPEGLAGGVPHAMTEHAGGDRKLVTRHWADGTVSWAVYFDLQATSQSAEVTPRWNTAPSCDTQLTGRRWNAFLPSAGDADTKHT